MYAFVINFLLSHNENVPFDNPSCDFNLIYSKLFCSCLSLYVTLRIIMSHD